MYIADRYHSCRTLLSVISYFKILTVIVYFQAISPVQKSLHRLLSFLIFFEGISLILSTAYNDHDTCNYTAGWHSCFDILSRKTYCSPAVTGGRLHKFGVYLWAWYKYHLLADDIRDSFWRYHGSAAWRGHLSLARWNSRGETFPAITTQISLISKICSLSTMHTGVSSQVVSPLNRVVTILNRCFWNFSNLSVQPLFVP